MGQYLNCPVFGGADQNRRLMAAYEPGAPGKTNHHDPTPANTAAVDGTAPTRGNGATRARELAKMGSKNMSAYGYGEPLLKKKHLEQYYPNATFCSTGSTREPDPERLAAST